MGLGSQYGLQRPGASGGGGLSTPNQKSILDIVVRTLYRMSGGRLTSYPEKFYIERDFLYFRPETLVSCLERAQLEPVLVHREPTDLHRRTLSPYMHLVLQGFSVAGRLLDRENRLFAAARVQGPPDAPLAESGR